MNSYINILKRKFQMKKNLMITASLILMGILAACSLPFSIGTQTSSTRSSQNSALADPSKLPVESKLGYGILKLEGTDQALDSTEAKELLPLFMALKTLSTNNNTAPEELTALNNQIKNTMKADQLTAIEKMTITSAELRTLIANNGSTTGSTSSNTNSSQSGGNFGGGGPGGGIPGITGGGGQTTNSSRVVATPNAAQAAQSSRRTAGGLNLTLAQPVIDLLNSKITK
jgi:hypothetical protein